MMNKMNCDTSVKSTARPSFVAIRNAARVLLKPLRGARKTYSWIMFVVVVIAVPVSINPTLISTANANSDRTHWIGTWATAAQPSLPAVQIYHNQTLRLIVHTSVGGKRVRIKISNIYGDQPLLIGGARIARR